MAIAPASERRLAAGLTHGQTHTARNTRKNPRESQFAHAKPVTDRRSGGSVRCPQTMGGAEHYSSGRLKVSNGRADTPCRSATVSKTSRSNVASQQPRRTARTGCMENVAATGFQHSRAPRRGKRLPLFSRIKPLDGLDRWRNNQKMYRENSSPGGERSGEGER